MTENNETDGTLAGMTPLPVPTRAFRLLPTLALAVLAFAAPAAAQTTLVSNEAHVSASGSSVFAAQSFTTGADSATISEIQLRLATGSGSTSLVLRADNSGEPGDVVATFTNPATLTRDAFNSFTAPANTTVQANTTYWVSAHEGVTGGRASLRSASGNGQTGASGWTIADGRKWRNSESAAWADEAIPLVIKILGTLKASASPPGQPNTPTLAPGPTSGTLAVNWAAPTSESAITDYDLRYFQGSNDPNSESDWVTEGAPGLSHPDSMRTVLTDTIRALQANSAYRVQVRAANANGEGPWSTSGVATTDTVPTANNAPKAEEATTCAAIDMPQVLATERAPHNTWKTTFLTRGTRTCGSYGQRGLIDPDGDAMTVFVTGTSVPADLIHHFSTSGRTAPIVSNNGRPSTDALQIAVLYRAITAHQDRNDTVSLRVVDSHGASATTSVVLQGLSFNGTSAPSFGSTVSDRSYPRNEEITNLVLPVATGGDVTLHSQTLPYFYAVSGLPPGLTFNKSTRTISGTPTTAGDYTVIYTADDFDRRYSQKDSPAATDLADAARDTFAIVVTSDEPTIQSVSIVSTPSIDTDDDDTADTYGVGDVIAVEVKFSEAVTTTADNNAVRLRMDLGDDDTTRGNSRRVLMLHSQTKADSALRFEYTVLSTDTDADGVWVQTASATNDLVVFLTGSATLQDSDGNHAVRTKTGLPTSGDANHKVDGSLTPPSGPAPTGAEVNGASLTVTFDKKLETATAPGTGTFTVARTSTPAPPAVTVSSVAFRSDDSTKVDLTLSAAVATGETGITVSYAKGTDANPLKGLSDDEVADFSGQAVTNVTPPAVTGAEVNGTALTLTFDAELDATKTPSTARFSVSGTTPATTVTAVAIPGGDATKVNLTLSPAVGAAATGITVTYTAGNDASPLQDGNANKVANFSAQAVTNATPPSVTDASVNGTVLTLTFDEALSTTAAPATTRFSVSAAVTTTVSAVAFRSGDATKLDLTLSPAVGAAETGITVAYTADGDTNALQDGDANEVADFSAQAVTNATPPSVTDASVNGTVLTLTFDEALSTTAAPDAGTFAVTGTTPATTVTAVEFRSGDATKLDLTVSPRVGVAETGIAVAYTAGGDSNPLQDGSGNRVANFTGRTVTNATPPSVTDAVVNGTELTLTFDAALSTTATPATGTFTVGGTTTATTVTAVEFRSGDATKLDLTLSVAVGSGETAVTLAYAAGSDPNPLQDGNGRKVADFTGRTVRNPASGAPSFPTTSSTLSVRENSAAGTVVGTVTATDPNADPLEYSLSSTASGGTDHTSFAIGLNTGRITVASGASLNFEAKSSYAVTVTASDGTSSASHQLTINLLNVAEPPSTPAPPTVTAASPTSLTVTWSAPSSAGARAVTDYDLRYYAGSSDPSNPSDWIEEGEANGPPNPGATTSAVISGLTANTAYVVQVRAAGDGESPWSASGSGTTGAGGTTPPPPPPPAPPTRGMVSADGATVTLEFAQALDDTSVPDPGDFTVTLATGSSTATSSSSAQHRVTAVAIRGAALDLTIAPPVPAGREAVVSYTKGSTPLRTAAGSEVPDFGVMATAPAATSQVSVADGSATEGSAVTFTVRLTSAVGADVVLGWSTGRDGRPGAVNATPDVDYTAVTGGRVTIPAGSLEATFEVATLADSEAEDAETFAVTIDGAGLPAGVTVATASAVGTIMDHPPALPPAGVEVTVEGGSALEGTAVEFTARLSQAADSDVVLDWSTGEDDSPGARPATPNVDYRPVSGGRVTVAAGSTEAMFSVATLADFEEEGDETFAVTVTGIGLPEGVTVATGTAVGTIEDDVLLPPPVQDTISVEGGSAVEGEPVTFTVRLSSAVRSDVVLRWFTSADHAHGAQRATADEDYTAVRDGRVRIAAGLTEATFAVATAADTLEEGDETFRVIITELEVPEGAGIVHSTAVGTIENYTPPPNEAPSFESPEYAFELEENTDGSAQSVRLGAVSATDPDGDELTYALAAGDSTRFAVGVRNGAVLYVGSGEDFEAEPNLYALTVRASDPAGESAEATVTVTVVNVNERPEAADDAATTDEDVAVEIDV
nr:SwmB domain-containing protein [Candidatus Palauibacter rhopaloidicola]